MSRVVFVKCSDTRPKAGAIYQREYFFRGRTYNETRVVLTVGYDPMVGAEGVTWEILGDTGPNSFSSFREWGKWVLAAKLLC